MIFVKKKKLLVYPRSHSCSSTPGSYAPPLRDAPRRLLVLDVGVGVVKCSGKTSKVTARRRRAWSSLLKKGKKTGKCSSKASKVTARRLRAWSSLLKVGEEDDGCCICLVLKAAWCDDPPEDRVISIFAGCLANHDRAHSL